MTSARSLSLGVDKSFKPIRGIAYKVQQYTCFTAWKELLWLHKWSGSLSPSV